MNRAFALVVVFTLAGTPIAALACVGLCGQPLEAGSQSACHDDRRAPTETPSLSGSHRCDTSLSDTPAVGAKAQRLLHQPMRHAAALPTALAVSAPHGGVRGHHKLALAHSPPVDHSSYAPLRV